jgi:hypothetical protein
VHGEIAMVNVGGWESLARHAGPFLSEETPHPLPVAPGARIRRGLRSTYPAHHISETPCVGASPLTFGCGVSPALGSGRRCPFRVPLSDRLSTTDRLVPPGAAAPFAYRPPRGPSPGQAALAGAVRRLSGPAAQDHPRNPRGDCRLPARALQASHESHSARSFAYGDETPRRALPFLSARSSDCGRWSYAFSA